MGKKAKAHRKKVKNRNKRRQDDLKHAQRLRAKLIQQYMKQQEELKKAEESKKQIDTEDDLKENTSDQSKEN